MNHDVRPYRVGNEAALVCGMMEFADPPWFRDRSRPKRFGMEINAGDPGMRRALHLADGRIALGINLQSGPLREIQEPEHVA